jgi:hypothetical protein
VTFGNYFDHDKPIPRSECTCPCHDRGKMVSHGRPCCYPDPDPPDLCEDGWMDWYYWNKEHDETQ